MSDRELGKKIGEEQNLVFFLEANKENIEEHLSYYFGRHGALILYASVQTALPSVLKWTG